MHPGGGGFKNTEPVAGMGGEGEEEGMEIVNRTSYKIEDRGTSILHTYSTTTKVKDTLKI